MKKLIAVMCLCVSVFANEQTKSFLYKDVIDFSKTTNNTEMLLAVGSLLSVGSNETDAKNNTLAPDKNTAYQLLLRAGELGNARGYTMLGSLMLMNNDSEKNTAISYLRKGLEMGDKEGRVILANTLLNIGENKEGLEMLFQSANEGDSSAQLTLAMYLQKGLKGANGWIIQADRRAAEHYLNLACNNDVKTEGVAYFCRTQTIQDKR